MTKTGTILCVLAMASSAHAGDSKDSPDTQRPPPMTIDELAKDPVVQKILTDAFPPIDTVDPGPQCKSVDAGHVFSIPLYEHDVGGNGTSVTGTARAGLVANTGEIGFHADVSPTVKLAGIKDTIQPFEVTLDAVTRATGESAVLLGVEAFGYTLVDKTVAATTASITENVPVAWTCRIPGRSRGPGTGASRAAAVAAAATSISRGRPSPTSSAGSISARTRRTA